MVGVLIGYMDCLRNNLSMSNTITAKFIGDDLAGLTLVIPD
jgi:hypothetical protein